MPGRLSDRERCNWLRLSRATNVGPVTFKHLLARFGSASTALEEYPRLVLRGGGTPGPLPSLDDVQRDVDGLARLGGRFIAALEDDYPAGLAALEAPPPIISVLGHDALLRRDMIAIVGARNASGLGRKLAQTLAADLGREGLVIASGMARGIDAAAHEGSLPSGTCAVLAGGIDIVYPPENAWLYDRIKAEGVIVSEMPLGQAPQARHFPRRNRIVSGLARGVVVVEAREGSGSLITANYALEQNREVFSVPGSPLDPRARGTNKLLRDGAVLTEAAEDVLAVLRPILGVGFREPDEPSPSTSFDLTEAETDRLRDSISEILGPAPLEIDEMIRLTGAPVAAVLSVLLELEIAGRLSRHPGNKVSWSC
ncbi:MAG: DNA-processing protein DprA [Alphaproteobacteria bacterium]|nr:DNA-processing protein DprA [Alphaproteobacteria bacterium]